MNQIIVTICFLVFGVHASAIDINPIGEDQFMATDIYLEILDAPSIRDRTAGNIYVYANGTMQEISDHGTYTSLPRKFFDTEYLQLGKRARLTRITRPRTDNVTILIRFCQEGATTCLDILTFQMDKKSSVKVPQVIGPVNFRSIDVHNMLVTDTTSGETYKTTCNIRAVKVLENGTEDVISENKKSPWGFTVLQGYKYKIYTTGRTDDGGVENQVFDVDLTK